MTTAPELRAGVLPSDGWLYVQETAPGLVATWQSAQADFDRSEPAWRERTAAYQRDRGIPRRRVPSPESKALALAEAAVAEALEELLGQGLVTYAGFRGGELGGAPEPIPLVLLGHRRPRGSRIKIRGVEFFDVKLYRANALRGPGRPTGKTRAPRDADDRLRTWLADVDQSQTIQEITAELTAAHPEIRAWWAESTATKRVAAALPVRGNDFRP